MRSSVFALALLILFCIPGAANALTIRNKCDYPVAGSLFSADSNVNLGQFRLAPGEKANVLKGIRRIKLIMHMTPDVYDLDKIGITKTEIDNPDCYIELRPGDPGIRIKVY